MKNKLYQPAYAEQLKKIQRENIRIKKLIDRAEDNIKILYDLSDDDLEKMAEFFKNSNKKI